MGHDYRPGLQIEAKAWAGSKAGGCVVGEVGQDAQPQGAQSSSRPSVCGSESNIYKPPYEVSQ